MRINRADPHLNTAIEALDQRLREAKRQAPKATFEEQRALAWSRFSPAEFEFVRDEIAHCIDSRVYYLNNFHVIQPELGTPTCINPLYAHQETVEEALVKCISADGFAYIIILKPRQSGMTEYCNGVMCWRTFFLPHASTISVAQDPKRAGHIQRKIMIAYKNLPWWMQSEQMYGTKGEYLEFGRKGNTDSFTDPGLGSTFITTHAQSNSGVAIGLTIRSAHLSEISRWPSGEVWTGDIEPSMNAPDRIAFAESTAYGNDTFQYFLWEEAESGESDWTPVFLAAYRAKKYSLPLKPSQKPFTLTPIEKSFTDRIRTEEGFEISDEFWNWRRKRVASSIKRTGFAYAHYEGFPITAREAFQSSGQGAFPRHKLDEQQQKNVCKPRWVGEIGYQGKRMQPKVMTNDMIDSDGRYLEIGLEKRQLTNRLYLWEEPNPDAYYYVGVDVGDGIMGGDFSVIEVFKAGYGLDPDVQVAEWVGYEPPIAFAKTVYALGWWYNQCEVAIEYAREGMSCANEFRMQLEYPKIYVPQRLDSTGTPMSHWVHWQTTGKTKPYLMTRMNESLLEDSIIIRSQYLLDELRRCIKDGLSFCASGGNDDAAVAGCISHYCLRETMPEMRRVAREVAPSAPAARHLHPPVGAVLYGVYDQLFRLRAQKRTLREAEEIVDVNPGFQIKPLIVSKANTAFSVIHHGNGIERELYQAGMVDRDITPQLVTQYGNATGRVFGAASPGADESMWDSTLGDLGEW